VGVDPIEFRLRYIEDPRGKAALAAVSEKAKWESRPSPKRKSGSSAVLTGRGVALALRGGTYVATIAEVEVNRHTGAVRVKRLVCAHDCGLIVNPEALRGTIQANLIQSMGRALKEEVTFDKGKVTSTNWNRYKILTMEEMPEIKVLQISRDDKGFGGGSEAANAIGPPAVAAAFFDATGVHARKIPLTSAYVTTLLRT